MGGVDGAPVPRGRRLRRPRRARSRALLRRGGDVRRAERLDAARARLAVLALALRVAPRLLEAPAHLPVRRLGRDDPLLPLHLQHPLPPLSAPPPPYPPYPV